MRTKGQKKIGLGREQLPPIEGFIPGRATGVLK